MNIIGDTVFPFSKELSLVVLILCVIKFYVDRWRIYSLGNKIPGPKYWPIFGNALELLENDLDIMEKFNYFNNKYGVTRLWLGSYLNVVICTPEDAEIVFRSTKLLDRTDQMKFFKPLLGDGLISASGAPWKKGKRLMEPLFTQLSIQSYFPTMQKNSDKLIRILREKSKEPGYPYHRCVANCFYDIISEATLDHTIGALDGNAEVPEIIEELMTQMWNRGNSVWQQIDFLYRYSKIGRKFYQSIALINDFFDNQIKSFEKKYYEEQGTLKNQSNEKNSRPKVFLHKLLDEELRSDDRELRHQIVTMITAGFETSSTAACFAAMMLGINKDVQEKLYQEVSSAPNEDLKVEDVMRLEYLDRVIKESMRIFPVVPIGFRQATEEVQFTDYLVPKGSAVLINTYLIHRDPKHWDNPNNFDPDHFLPEKVSDRHRYAYHPFSLGRRKCIAGKFALISIKLILAKIVLNFKIDCDVGMKDIEREMRVNLTLKMRNAYYPIRLTPR